MELIQTINQLDNTPLERTVVNINADETISYNTPTISTFTVTLNHETTINNTYRICLRSISDTIYLYITHATPSNYRKYELADINSIEVTC